MFANTIDLTFNTDTITLNRVNQDNYGSSYQYLGSNLQYYLKIRHTTDAPDADGIIMVRHNVYVERIEIPASTDERINKQTATFTFRSEQGGVTAYGRHLAQGLIALLGADLPLGSLEQGIN